MGLEIQAEFLEELCGLMYNDELPNKKEEEEGEDEVRDDRFITL